MHSNTGTVSPATSLPPITIHPLWLRVTHWLNAVAVILLVTSGWRIYNASPIWDFAIPPVLTLGGWLGGALQWHFAAMWLLGINGLLYIGLNVLTGRFRGKFWPLSLQALWSDTRAALQGHLSHAEPQRYNMVQKLLYLAVIADAVLLVLSGLVVWKSVQFPLLRALMTGYDNARIVHFCAMAFLVGFVVLHVVMALLVPRTLLAMVRGR